MSRLLHPLGLTLLCCSIYAQLHAQSRRSIDDFSVPVATIEVSSFDLSFPQRDMATILNNLAVGGETDILLNLVAAPDTSSGLKASINDGKFRLRSDPGTKGQLFLSYDGRDGSADTIRATDGLGNFDLTQGGTLDRLTFSLQNPGAALGIDFIAFSDPDNASSFTLNVPSADTSDYSLPFDTFNPANLGADFTKVNAILVIFGRGGGAEGPLDVTMTDFYASSPPPQPPGPTFLVNQLGFSPGDTWFMTDFGGNNPFNALIADDFVVGDSFVVENLSLDGTYSPSAPGNPTIDVFIYENNNGAPGEVVIELGTLPLVSSDPITVSLGPDGVTLPPGIFWIGARGNVPIGTELTTTGSGTTAGFPAHWQNPGGAFGQGCPGFRPLSECQSQDRSWRFAVSGQPVAPAGPALAVTKSVSPEKANVGDTLTFVITVRNTGTQVLSNIRVKDFIPFKLDFVSAAPSRGTCSFDSRVIMCNLDDLGPEEESEILILVVARSFGKESNRALVDATVGESAKVEGRSTVNFELIPNLTITKTSPLDEYLVGSKIPFTITVTNTSLHEIADVEIEDTFSGESFAYVSDSGDCDRSEDPPTIKLVCRLGSMSPGEIRTITVTLRTTRITGSDGNFVFVTSARGIEDLADRKVKFSGELPLRSIYIYSNLERVFQNVSDDPDRKLSSRQEGEIDVYLNDSLVVDNLAPGESSGPVDVVLSSYPFRLFVVDADAPDASQPIDSVDLDIDISQDPDVSTTFSVVLSADTAGALHATMLNNVRTESADPSQADVVLAHASAGLGPIDASLSAPPGPLALAEDLPFGAFGSYHSIDPPGGYNLTVAPADGSEPAEVWFVPTDTPGEVYTLVIGPAPAATAAFKGASGSTGQLEAVTLFAYDSKGARIETKVVTDIEESGTLPGIFALYQNYPNPFNPRLGATTIRYDVPKPSQFSLSIFDVTGRRVVTLVDGNQAAGSHNVEWDGKDAVGRQVAAGLYLVRLLADDFGASRTMMLVK